MKKSIFTLITVISCLVIQNNFAQTYNIDISKSTLNWQGKAAFNSYSPSGSINVKSGKITLEDSLITSLKIIVDMKSLDHENADLKKHLRNKDFFEVKKYTEAIFQIDEPVEIKNNQAEVIGKMTIKGITREEKVLLNFKDQTMNFNIQLDRTKYNIKFNSPSFFKKLKENAIADEFNLKGELVFN
ncbi:MAG: YceI family protein [bacterium]